MNRTRCGYYLKNGKRCPNKLVSYRKAAGGDWKTPVCKKHLRTQRQ